MQLENAVINQSTCNCQKILTDDNVGLLRKSNSVSYVAHKVAVVCGVKGELPLSRTVFKGNQSDSITFEETLKDFKQAIPEQVVRAVKYVTADGIYQSADNQQHAKELLNAKLIAPINPRKIKEKLVDIRGVEKITSYGVPVCMSGHSMQLKGYDAAKEQFVWVCPVFHDKYRKEGLTCSAACHTKCCNQAKTGRTVRIERSLTPQIDPEFPQHLSSFKDIYKERTAIERVFAQLKDGFSMRRVHKRGKQAVEAHMDRCITISHLLAFVSVMETGQLYRGWARFSA
ncbi:transposase [Fodinisporobacter ferrooxydans]|uniref:Transposase n=1 Tax=Fodinisporobacter ferrooxydans TaxID=2901836 RepID=A0ABY4CMA5_9BACL|nr:transposase [Alicyclobacillaceae bacterium MYW30-H2]